MKEFTIVESKWRCGGNGLNKHGSGPTKMLNHQGYMCCLGQIASQCGVPDKFLNGKSTPILVEEEALDDLPETFVDFFFQSEGRHKDFVGLAMAFNDSDDTIENKSAH